MVLQLNNGTYYKKSIATGKLKGMTTTDLESMASGQS